MSPKALAYTEVDAPGTAFGLGVSVVVDPSIVTHMTSKGCFSWGGAASTLFWVDPQEDLVVRKTSRMETYIGYLRVFIGYLEEDLGWYVRPREVEMSE